MGFWSGLAVGYILHGGKKRGPHPKSIKARLRRRRAYNQAVKRQAVIVNRQRGGYQDPRDFWTR